MLAAGLLALWGCLPDIVLAPQDAAVEDRLEASSDVATPQDVADAEATSTDLPPADAIPQADLPPPTDAGPCGMRQTLCGDACVELGSNVDHCGRCGNFCPQPTSGMRVCREGVCGAQCSVGTTQCDGRCVVLATERTHCGACGRACAAVQFCVDGGCSDTP
jgi:hypothetical protein